MLWPQRTQRLLWPVLPPAIRAAVETLAGDHVVAHANQSGGFSPGLAARLTLANGDTVFAKAGNSQWPTEAGFHPPRSRGLRGPRRPRPRPTAKGRVR